MTQALVRAVGDLALYRGVPAGLERLGLEEFCREAREDLAPGVLRFANMEVPLSARPVNDAFSLVGPLAVAPVIRQLGLNVVSVANNHIMDAGVDSFFDTLEAIRGQGAHPVGGGRNLEEARQPYILEDGKFRIGMLAYSEGNARLYHHVATSTRPGAAPIERDLILEDIAALRPKVDFLVLSLHWGVNYIPYGMPEQRALARDFVQAGTNLILGHHPHVVQGCERIEPAVVAYSLGDFICDAGGGNVVKPERVAERGRTAVFAVDLHPDGKLTHHWTPYQANEEFKPCRLSGSAAADALARLEHQDDLYEHGYPKDAWAGAGGKIGEHAMEVLWFHFKRGNFGYLAKRLFRIRRRHLRMLKGLLLGKRTGR